MVYGLVKKHLTPAIPNGSSLRDLWGAVITWSNFWKNRLVKQEPKVVWFSSLLQWQAGSQICQLASYHVLSRSDEQYFVHMIYKPTVFFAVNVAYYF